MIGRMSEAEFQSLYLSLGGKIKRTISGMVGNDSVAEELTQETFIKAWNNLPFFMGKSKLTTWIYQIALNSARDHLRVKKLSPQEEEVYVSDSPERRAVREALLESHEEERELLVLFYYEEFNIREMGIILKIPEGTVKSRLHSARENLRKSLLKKGFDV